MARKERGINKMFEYNNTVSYDELYHYGVLGMKWGVRRARKNGASYVYKSHGQKKYEKKIDQIKSSNKKNKKENKKEKLAKAKTKLSIYKQRDKNRQSYASKTNLGKAVVKQILMGPIGSGSYSRYRSSGNSRVMAFLKSNVISSLLSSPVTVPLSRHREMKTAKKQLGIKKK